MAVVLSVLAEVIRCLGLIIQPIMPESSSKMLDQLLIPQDERTFAYLDPQHGLKAGTEIPQPQGVFPRIVEEEAA